MSAIKFQPSVAAVVTPSDTANLSVPSSEPANSFFSGAILYVGVPGNLRVLVEGGQDVTFQNVPIGFFPVQVIRVFATNTSASGIIALW
jgi:hypothetical protein